MEREGEGSFEDTFVRRTKQNNVSNSDGQGNNTRKLCKEK
jgi:hypothetical protein